MAVGTKSYAILSSILVKWVDTVNNHFIGVGLWR